MRILFIMKHGSYYFYLNQWKYFPIIMSTFRNFALRLKINRIVINVDIYGKSNTHYSHST